MQLYMNELPFLRAFQWSRSLACLLPLLCLLASPALAGESASQPTSQPQGKLTPWDLPTLFRPPVFHWVKQDGAVRSLIYAGLAYQDKPSTQVFALYASPATLGLAAAGQQKFPAIVLVHGGVGRAYADWVELWARRGYAAIAMDLYGNDGEKKRLPEAGPAESATQLPVRELKDAWPYHGVANVILAHSLVRSFPEVDAERTAITGVSWGGFLTCTVAGLDPRFKAAVPVYGCGFVLENREFFAPIWRQPPADRDRWVRSFDPSRYLPDAHMPVFYINGARDGAFWLASSEKSYGITPGLRNLRFTVNMAHSQHEGSAPPEIALFIDEHLNHGVPLPVIQSPQIQGTSAVAPVRAETRLISATLCYTSDTAANPKRQWHEQPASIEHDRLVAAAPPSDALVWFLTVTDDRGATVSSPLMSATAR